MANEDQRDLRKAYLVARIVDYKLAHAGIYSTSAATMTRPLDGALYVTVLEMSGESFQEAERKIAELIHGPESGDFGFWQLRQWVTPEDW